MFQDQCWSVWEQVRKDDRSVWALSNSGGDWSRSRGRPSLAVVNNGRSPWSSWRHDFHSLWVTVSWRWIWSTAVRYEWSQLLLTAEKPAMKARVVTDEQDDHESVGWQLGKDTKLHCREGKKCIVKIMNKENRKFRAYQKIRASLIVQDS